MSDLEHPVDAVAFESPEPVPVASAEPIPAAAPPPPPAAPPASPDRPELAIGGAFAGGLVLALILKRIAS